MKKLIAVFVLIFSLSLVLISCGDKYVSKYDANYVYDGVSLVGKWVENNHSDKYYQVYEISEEKIILTAYSYGIEMQQITATYKVEGNNTLAVSWGDGYVDRNDFSITEDNIFVLTQVLASETGEMELIPYNLDWNTDNSMLVGTWISNEYNGEVFTFKSNYKLIVEGLAEIYQMPYAVSGSTLAFGGEFVENFKEEVNVMTYQVEGDTLTLTGKNEDGSKLVLTFTRG